MRENTKDDLMVGAASLTLSLAVAAGAAFTTFVFQLGCALSETGAGRHIPCTGPWMLLPLIATATALVAWFVLAFTRNARLYWWGTGFATVSGALLWIIWGDPAGNFGGLVGW